MYWILLWDILKARLRDHEEKKPKKLGRKKFFISFECFFAHDIVKDFEEDLESD